MLYVAVGGNHHQRRCAGVANSMPCFCCSVAYAEKCKRARRNHGSSKRSAQKPEGVVMASGAGEEIPSRAYGLRWARFLYRAT